MDPFQIVKSLKQAAQLVSDVDTKIQLIKLADDAQELSNRLQAANEKVQRLEVELKRRRALYYCNGAYHLKESDEIQEKRPICDNCYITKNWISIIGMYYNTAMCANCGKKFVGLKVADVIEKGFVSF